MVTIDGRVVFMEQGDTIKGSDFLLADIILGRIKDYDYRVVEDKTGKVRPDANTVEIIPSGLYKLLGYALKLIGT
jgi:hypothetical protein